MAKPPIQINRNRAQRNYRKDGALSPAAKRSLTSIIAFAVLILCTLIAIFVVRPHLRNSRFRQRLLTANELYRSGKAEKAIEQYRLLEEDYPDSSIAREASMRRKDIEPYIAEARAMMLQADTAFRQEDYEEAHRLYAETAERFPLSLKGASASASMPGCAKLACDRRDEKALAAEKINHWDEALLHYSKILELIPNYPYAEEGRKTATEKIAQFNKRMKQANAAENNRQWAEARKEYDLALKILPDSLEAFESRTRVLTQIPSPPGMVFLRPSQTVIFGSNDGQPDESPQRTVRSYGFHMDVHEVTNAAYAKFVDETGRTPPPHWGGGQPSAEMAELPIVCVSWHDATAYAMWAGKRLPTEEEWERAARGTNGRTYPWGETFRGTEGVFSGKSAPVGQVPTDCTPEGCFDMGGNVSEWTASEKVVLQPSSQKAKHRHTSDHNTRGARPTAQKEPTAEPLNGLKVIRGASWAGLEAHRSCRVVPQASATSASDPLKTVLVDHPTSWGIETFGLADTEFFLRGASNGIPVIEIRKWFSYQDKYISTRFLIHLGARIEGERSIRITRNGISESFRVRYNTGCRLLAFEVSENSNEMQITYVDPNGIRHVMKRLPPNTVLPAVRKKPCSISETVLKALSERTLSSSVRCSNRMAAPPDTRFINCGFRCVKDP